jgi:cation:H+ antiporter
MELLQFKTFPLWINLVIFAGAAVVVWMAGTRLADYTDSIASRTGLSHAFLGLILLGFVTSLPEIATTVTATTIGNTSLVANNLFGGVAAQITVLAIVDLIAVRGALTYFTPQPILLFQGMMLLLLLSVAMAGAAAGEPVSFFGMGLTPFLLLAGYLLTVYMSRGADYLPRWRATDEVETISEQREPGGGPPNEGDQHIAMSNHKLYLYAFLAALFILIAGWTLAHTADALAQQTALGSSFVGVALLAVSTSLPEVSTTLAAVQRGNYEMAVSNILGTNCLEVALFFLADLLYFSAPILALTDKSAIFAASLGMIVTCIFVLGLLERRDRTVLGMGVDSLIVLAFYITGLGGLYYIR